MSEYVPAKTESELLTVRLSLCYLTWVTQLSAHIVATYLLAFDTYSGCLFTSSDCLFTYSRRLVKVPTIVLRWGMNWCHVT